MGFVYQNCLVCNKHKSQPEPAKLPQHDNIKSELNDDQDEPQHNNDNEDGNSTDTTTILNFFCKQFQLSSNEKNRLINLDLETPFCEKCADRLAKLDELQEQFLLIQREMYTLQACLSLAILTENGNDNNDDEGDEVGEKEDDDDRPLVDTLARLKTKKSCNFINAIRNNIRQRFKPKVVLTRKTDTKIRKISPSTQSTNKKQQVNNTNEDYYSDCEYNDPLYFDDENYDSNKEISNKNHKQTATKINKEKERKQPPSTSTKSTDRKKSSGTPASQAHSTAPVKKSTRLREKVSRKAAATTVEIIEIDDTAEPEPKKPVKSTQYGNTDYWEKRKTLVQVKYKKPRKQKYIYITPATVRKRKEERARIIQEKKEAEENVEYDMSWVQDGDDDEEEDVDAEDYDDDFNPDLYIHGTLQLKSLPYKSNRPFAVTRETETPGVYQQGDSPWTFQQIPGLGWKCLAPGCNYSSDRRTKVLNHIHQEHDTTRPRCEICNVAYIDDIALRQHVCKGPPRKRTNVTVEVSEGKFLFKGYEFEKVDRFQNEGKDYKCSVIGCGHLTRKKQEMPGHINIAHINPNSILCEMCGKGFPNQSLLEKHLRSHTQDHVHEYFYCDQCPVKRSSRSSLMIHVRVHHEGYRYQCGSCDCKYQTPSCLRRHLQTTGHTKMQGNIYDDLDCSLCGSKRFANERTLNRHLQNCKGRTKYSCEICLANGEPKDFVMFISLQKHAKLAHNQDLVLPQGSRKRRKPVDMNMGVVQEKVARETTTQDQNTNDHTGQELEQKHSQQIDSTMTTTTTTNTNFNNNSSSTDAFAGASSSSSSFPTTTPAYQQPSVIDYSNPYMNFPHGYFPQ